MQDLPHHRNVVFLFGVTENPYCLVSQLIEDACELQDHLTKIQKHLGHFGRHRVLQITLRLLRDACMGLAHLHEHRILHCDIAARNVLVANSGNIYNCDGSTARPRAKINDFGLSRKLGDHDDRVEFSGGYDRCELHVLVNRIS